MWKSGQAWRRGRYASVVFAFWALHPLGDSELDAAAHRVDPFGADTHPVAEMPSKFFGFCAASTTRSRRTTPAFASRQRYHGVIAFAENDAPAGGILERVDRQQTLDKYLKQLNKASKLLHRNNQRFVFLTEMRFHELRRLPIH
jgi:hypothetical protein